MRLFFAILFMILSLNVSAQDISATLKPEAEGVLNIKEGDTFVAKFVVWPITFVDDGVFKKEYTDKKFLDFFHVTEVLSEKFSENNTEAYEVEARLILTKFFNPQNLIIWSYRGLNIPVKVTGINPMPLDGRNKDFVILSQQYTEQIENNWLPWGIVIFLLIVLIGYFLLKKREKKREELKKLKIQEGWANRFHNAKQREDFERLYSARKDWEKYIPVKTPEMLEFYNIINEHQYKKEWSDEITREVSETFDEIRTILN